MQRDFLVEAQNTLLSSTAWKKLLAASCIAVLAGCGGGASTETAVQADEQSAQQSGQQADEPTEAFVSAEPVAAALISSTTTTTTTEKAPLGVNLEGLSDYSRLPPFVDLMKMSRTWGSADAPWDETVPRDAKGWPTTDAGVVVAMVTKDEGDTVAQGYLTAGVYKLRFNGRASVEPTASGGVTITNALYDPTKNVSTADVVIGAGATQLMLSFRNTVGGVKNVSLRRPGYASTEVFTNEFRQAVAPFGVLRLMDVLRTNGNPVRKWAERTLPTSGTQTGPKGAAYEHAVQMANKLGKDIWINIPVGADDDYIRQLATLLKGTLNAKRTVYVEYSNEIWNFIFQQATDNMQMAVAEAVAGDTTLTRGQRCTQAAFDAMQGECNPYWAGYFRVGKRAVRISQIFSEVYGAAAINKNVRVVYATQFANPGIAEQVLKNIATYRGAPSASLYAVATAPYFQLSAATAASTTATKDDLLAGLETALLTENQPYFASGISINGVFTKGRAYNGGDSTGASHKALADYYGIKSVAYEGGPDLLQDGANTARKIAANKDARMGDLVKSEVGQWYGCGNDLFMYFSLTSQWDQWGYWGLTNDGTNLTAPKYAAAKQVAQTARSNFTACN